MPFDHKSLAANILLVGNDFFGWQVHLRHHGRVMVEAAGAAEPDVTELQGSGSEHVIQLEGCASSRPFVSPYGQRSVALRATHGQN